MKIKLTKYKILDAIIITYLFGVLYHETEALGLNPNNVNIDPPHIPHLTKLIFEGTGRYVWDRPDLILSNLVVYAVNAFPTIFVSPILLVLTFVSKTIKKLWLEIYVGLIVLAYLIILLPKILN